MIITGKAYWAKVLKPTSTFDKTGEEYTIDVSVDGATRAKLEEAGLEHKIKSAINPKNGKEHASKSEYIKINVPTKTPKGDDISAPMVKDRFGQDWDKEILIGNGSEVDVMFYIREGEMASGPWKKPSLQGVRVRELVEVEPRESFEYDEAPDDASEVWED